MPTRILMPTSGTIRCAGLDPSRERKQLAHSIGTVFDQKSQLWYHLPAIDTYELFSRIYEIPRAAYCAANAPISPFSSYDRCPRRGGLK